MQKYTDHQPRNNDGTIPKQLATWALIMAGIYLLLILITNT